MSTLPVAFRDRLEEREVIETIKQTVCKGATDPQLKVFLEVCRSTGLNPFLKEIWYVAEKGIIMAARDGYLRVANENPQFDGIETRVERDEKNVPIKAVCTVWRKDRQHPVICEAYFNEYVKQSPVWKQYPSAMIAKVSEVLALKRSFSINGVVSEEEIGHDGRGSAAAAQAVAQAKIDGALPLEPTETQVEAIVEAAAAAPAEPPKPKKVPDKAFDKFKALTAMHELKAEFEKCDMVEAYYVVLKHYGCEKSNQLPTNDGGHAWRSCYRDMGKALAEVKQYYTDNQFPDWEALQDAKAFGHNPVWINGIRWNYAEETSSYIVAVAG